MATWYHQVNDNKKESREVYFIKWNDVFRRYRHNAGGYGNHHIDVK